MSPVSLVGSIWREPEADSEEDSTRSVTPPDVQTSTAEWSASEGCFTSPRGSRDPKRSTKYAPCQFCGTGANFFRFCSQLVEL